MTPSTSIPPDEGGGHLEDAACIRAVRGGDTEAFGRLVDRHAPELHRTLHRFFRDEADVEDLLQESFVRAFAKLASYDPTRAFFPWLRRIAVNLALDELERRRRRAEVEAREELMAVLPGPERSDARLGEEELVEAVDEGLETMPPAWAAVLRLRVQEELGYAEIAEALEIPIGTVMSRLARARARLAEHLARRFGPRPEATP